MLPQFETIGVGFSNVGGNRRPSSAIGIGSGPPKSICMMKTSLCRKVRCPLSSTFRCVLLPVVDRRLVLNFGFPELGRSVQAGGGSEGIPPRLAEVLHCFAPASPGGAAAVALAPRHSPPPAANALARIQRGSHLVRIPFEHAHLHNSDMQFLKSLRMGEDGECQLVASSQIRSRVDVQHLCPALCVYDPGNEPPPVRQRGNRNGQNARVRQNGRVRQQRNDDGVARRPPSFTHRYNADSRWVENPFRKDGRILE